VRARCVRPTAIVAAVLDVDDGDAAKDLLPRLATGDLTGAVASAARPSSRAEPRPT